MADSKGYPNADRHDRLRQSARDMLDKGAAPLADGGSLSVEALQLLYQRASKPECAADALRLLHELQTYQVELDMLYEQLQTNEQELAEVLTHYKSIFDLAPAPYLIVARAGEIIEGNHAAGELFGEPAGSLAGKALYAFLAPGQEGVVNTLLRNSGEPAPVNAEKVAVRLPDGRPMTITARPVASGDNLMMILTEAATHSAGS